MLWTRLTKHFLLYRIFAIRCRFEKCNAIQDLQIALSSSINYIFSLFSFSSASSPLYANKRFSVYLNVERAQTDIKRKESSIDWSSPTGSMDVTSVSLQFKKWRIWAEVWLPQCDISLACSHCGTKTHWLYHWPRARHLPIYRISEPFEQIHVPNSSAATVFVETDDVPERSTILM